MRLFVAISIPDHVKRAIQHVTPLLNKYPGVKTVSRENLHLNLEFLGDRKPESVKETLQAITFEPFTLETTEYGFFPNEDHIRVVWLGIQENPKLKELQRRISKLTDNDKEYIPHITMARIKNIKQEHKEQLLQTLDDNPIDPQTFQVNNFKLYESQTTSIGPIYNIVEKFPQT